MGLNTLDEVLNYVPGLQSWFDSFFGTQHYVSARGSTGLGNDVLYLYNGRRLNNHQNNNGHSFNHLMALKNIKQVEIIRRPASSLYGSGAFAAVINVVVDEQANNLQLEIGEHNSRRAALNLSHQSDNNNWSSALFLHGFKDDGEHYRDAFDIYGGSDNTRDPNRVTTPRSPSATRISRAIYAPLSAAAKTSTSLPARWWRT